MNFFEILQDILGKKSGGILYKNSEFKKAFSPYILIRYLSMRDSLLTYALILNKLQCSLNSEQIYKWCYNNIPKQKNTFIKYISKKKKKENNEKED